VQCVALSASGSFANPAVTRSAARSVPPKTAGRARP